LKKKQSNKEKKKVKKRKQKSAKRIKEEYLAARDALINY